MLRFSISTNAAQVARQIEEFADQIPYATARALSYTAQDAQGYLRDHLDDHMTVRGTWVRNSIRYRPAKKGVSPVAYVGSVYEPMALQVEGGAKEGVRGRDVAVPVWARRDKTNRTSPEMWPARLIARAAGAMRARDFNLRLSRSRVFVIPIGDGNQGVYERLGRGERGRLRLWWVLRDSVEIEPRWPAYGEVAQVVRSEFGDNFWAAMEQARATARPKT